MFFYLRKYFVRNLYVYDPHTTVHTHNSNDSLSYSNESEIQGELRTDVMLLI
jgi:hypothetical protein